MPKLITTKTKKPLPPCGRRIKYVAPWSPWQKLVDAARMRLGLSYGDIATKIGAHKGSVWIWFCSPNGFPHPKSFTAERASALYSLLKLDPRVAAQALDASRHLYTDKETPMPFKAVNAFAQFIETIEQIGQTRIYKSTILNIARRCQAGLSPANPGHPQYPDSRSDSPGPRAPRAGKRL